MSDKYGLRFAGPPKAMDLSLIYRALSQRQVDLIAGNSTDGLIDSLGLVVLEDDQRFQVGARDAGVGELGLRGRPAGLHGLRAGGAAPLRPAAAAGRAAGGHRAAGGGAAMSLRASRVTPAAPERR